MAQGDFNIANATYGRDQVGTSRLLIESWHDIDRSIQLLTTAPEYQNFINTVQSNWQGPDADKMIAEFKQAVANLAESYKRYKQILGDAVVNDAQQFGKMQNVNADLLQGISSQIK